MYYLLGQVINGELVPSGDILIDPMDVEKVLKAVLETGSKIKQSDLVFQGQPVWEVTIPATKYNPIRIEYWSYMEGKLWNNI